jgi:PAS domain-containing protein
MMFRGRPARLVVIHDVTERKATQDLARRSDERYRRLIEESTDGITLARVGGGFMAVNPASSA